MSGSSPEAPGAPPSRRDRLITLSRAVRGALVARFGPAWRSKTTEEIAHEAGLAEAFGVEEAARLLRFLQEADLAKFAEEGELAWNPLPDREEDWVEAFLAGAGARTTIGGDSSQAGRRMRHRPRSAHGDGSA